MNNSKPFWVTFPRDVRKGCLRTPKKRRGSMNAPCFLGARESMCDHPTLPENLEQGQFVSSSCCTTCFFVRKRSSTPWLGWHSTLPENIEKGNLSKWLLPGLDGLDGASPNLSKKPLKICGPRGSWAAAVRTEPEQGPASFFLKPLCQNGGGGVASPLSEAQVDSKAK